MNTLSPDFLDSETVVAITTSATEPSATPDPAPEEHSLSDSPPRPAWIEIDLKRLRRNFELINQDKPGALRVLCVVKDGAYGHGTLQVAKAADEAGEERTILFNLSGHGHFDMAAYDNYFAGKLEDVALDEDEMSRALEAIEGLPTPA